MTAPNITPRHTNAAHRHHLVTKFTRFLFKGVILVGRRLLLLYTYHYNYISSIPVYQSYSQSRHGGAHKHWFSSQTLFAYIPPGQQPQITCRRSRSFLQRLRCYTHSSQLPDLITTHTITPLNLPTFSTQSATFLNLL